MNTFEKNYRDNVEAIKKGKRTSPLKAIKLHCQECMGWSVGEIDDCQGDDECILFAYRKGKNNSGKRTGEFKGKLSAVKSLKPSRNASKH